VNEALNDRASSTLTNPRTHAHPGLLRSLTASAAAAAAAVFCVWPIISDTGATADEMHRSYIILTELEIFYSSTV